MTTEMFWKALTIAALVWYSSVTVYVSVNGAADIKEMLRRLGKRRSGGSDGGEQTPRTGI